MQYVTAAIQLRTCCLRVWLQGVLQVAGLSSGKPPTFSKVAINSLADVTSTTVAPGTMTMPLMSRLISNRGCLTCRQQTCIQGRQ